jgi:3-hydroxyisobutyrate dehydrogenase
VTAGDARRIAFVGLGQMGGQLSAHIAGALPAGYEVVGFDLDRGRAEHAGEASGIGIAADIEAAMTGAHVVCLSVPDGSAVAQVVASIPRDVAAGVVVIDFSSVSPDEAARFAADLGALGGRYFDAPVTGGVAGARAGTLTTMVGGPAAFPDDLTWLLEAFSKRVVFTGASGTGALLKTISNMIGNITTLVSIEGILVARAAGIPDEVYLEVFNNGPARSFFSEFRYPNYVLTGTFDAGMRLGLVNKDLGIALEAAASLGVRPRVCEVGRGIWRAAMGELTPEADTTQVVQYVSMSETGSPWPSGDVG